MKKIILFFTLALLSVMLSGCTKYQANIEINDNLDVTTSLFYGSVNSSVIKQIAPVEVRDKVDDIILKTLEKQVQKNKDFNTEIKKDGEYIGLVMTRTNPNDSEVFLPPGISSKNNYVTKVKQKLYKKVYIVALSVDTKTLKKTTTEFSEKLKDNPFYSTYVHNAGKPIYQVVVKIPHKATATNATTKDDINHAYTWDLDIDKQEPIDMHLEYEKYYFSPKLLLYILLIIIAISQTMNSVKIKKKDTNYND